MRSTLLVAFAAALAPAAAFMPAGAALRPAGAARAVPRALHLQAQAADEKEVTLGLAAPVLGDNAQAKEVFGFLQSKTYTKDREGFILGDVFADGVVRNGGFSEFSEKVNGRVAQIAFPLGLSQTFGEDGDFLNQLAIHPIQVDIFPCRFTNFEPSTDSMRRLCACMRSSSSGERLQLILAIAMTQCCRTSAAYMGAVAEQALLLSGVILYASLPPLFDAREDDRRAISVFKAAVPGEVRTQLMDIYGKSGLDKIFTEEAELTNSRAAMIAMAVWLFTASIF